MESFSLTCWWLQAFDCSEFKNVGPLESTQRTHEKPGLLAKLDIVFSTDEERQEGGIENRTTPGGGWLCPGD